MSGENAGAKLNLLHFVGHIICLNQSSGQADSPFALYQFTRSNIRRPVIHLKFQCQTVTPCVLSFPELSDGFGGIIQPFTIRQQRNQFGSAEKLHHVRLWSASARNFPASSKRPAAFITTETGTPCSST